MNLGSNVSQFPDRFVHRILVREPACHAEDRCNWWVFTCLGMLSVIGSGGYSRLVHGAEDSLFGANSPHRICGLLQPLGRNAKLLDLASSKIFYAVGRSVP